MYYIIAKGGKKEGKKGSASLFSFTQNTLCLPEGVHKFENTDLLCFCSVVCLLCLCARLFICALWSPAGKRLTSWFLFVVSNCEFVTFPLVSWVRCGT